MKTLRFPLCVAIVALAVLGAREALAEQVVWAQTLDEAWQLAQEHDRPMLVFITRNGCKYCTKMKAETYSNSAVAREVNNRFVPVMVNAANSRDLVQKLNIKGYPTTVVILPDYRVAEQVKGYLSPVDLQRRLTSVHSRYAALPGTPKGSSVSAIK